MMGYDSEDSFLFCQSNLPDVTFPIFQDIRAQGKLCDVTIKVSVLCLGQI